MKKSKEKCIKYINEKINSKLNIDYTNYLSDIDIDLFINKLNLFEKNIKYKQIQFIGNQINLDNLKYANELIKEYKYIFGQDRVYNTLNYILTEYEKKIDIRDEIFKKYIELQIDDYCELYILAKICIENSCDELALHYIYGLYESSKKNIYQDFILSYFEKTYTNKNNEIDKLSNNKKELINYIERYINDFQYLDITLNTYEKFILKLSEINLKYCNLDKAIRGYKNIIINSKDEELVNICVEKIEQIYKDNFYQKLINTSNIKIIEFDNDSKKELITICVASYKNLIYIEETLKSILKQEFNNLELIIADDGTSSFEIDKYLKYISENNRGNISRLIVYKNEVNLGTVSNCNKAISLSTGKYIKFIAADDIFYDKKSLRKLYEYIKNSDYKIITSNIQWCDEKLQERPDAMHYIKKYNMYLPHGNNPEIFKNILYNGCQIPAPGVFFKKEVFDIYGMFNEKCMLIEDYPYWLNIVSKNCKIGYIDLISVKYRAGIGISFKKNKYYLNDELYIGKFIGELQNEK